MNKDKYKQKMQRRKEVQ
ncbi:hypothetical protein, partial [Spirulina sp. 06S082]